MQNPNDEPNDNTTQPDKPPTPKKKKPKPKEALSFVQIKKLQVLYDLLGGAWLSRRTLVSRYTIEQAAAGLKINKERVRAIAKELAKVDTDAIRRALGA